MKIRIRLDVAKEHALAFQNAVGVADTMETNVFATSRDTGRTVVTLWWSVTLQQGVLVTQTIADVAAKLGITTEEYS